MSEIVKFGILGLGMGANRARLIPKTSGAKLVSVCDLQEEKVKQIAKELNCEWTTSYDEMLRRNDIDVIGVFTSSGTHCDHAIKAMEAGKHAFVTKPMDITVEKCDHAIAVARKTRKIFAVDFGMRYEEKNQKVKLALNKGSLGRLFLCDLRMKWFRDQGYYNGGYPPGWRSIRETEGGSAANQGVHSIDFIQWLMGPVKNVYGRSGTFAHKIETEDLSIALLTFQNGAWGSIITTTTSYPDLGTSTEITGEKGSIIIKEDVLYKLKNNPEASLEEFKPDRNLPKNIIEDMVLAIKKGTSVMVDGKEGRKATAIFNAIYESSRTGKVIELK